MTRQNNSEYVAMPVMIECDECSKNAPKGRITQGLCPDCSETEQYPEWPPETHKDHE